MKRLLLLSLVSFAFIFSKAQSLQLQHPPKGDVWPIYSVKKIQWQFANVDNIKIEVSTDSAKSWSVVQPSYPASATYYDWTVINKASDSCYLRISDVANPSVQSSGYPGNPFVIPSPTLQIDNVEPVVFSKTVLPISWAAEGTQAIKLSVSYDDRRSFRLIADNVPAAGGFYNWVVKDTVAANCFILVQSLNNSAISDTISQPFSIRHLPGGTNAKYNGGSYDGHTSGTNQLNSLVLLSPNRKEKLTANSIYPITWNSTGIRQIDIKYSTDNGATWLTIANGFDAGLSLYNWLVPAAPTAIGLIKISDAIDPAVFDSSDSTFTINSNSLRFTSPLEKETAAKGQVLPISWTSSGISKINISYLDRSGWKTIATGVNASAEVFNWAIPASFEDSVQLKIADFDDPSSIDTVARIYLKKAFSPAPAKYNGGSYDGHSNGTNKKPVLTLTSPNGNEQIASAISYNITWTGASIEKVDVTVSFDNGRSWQTVASSLPNTGMYVWRVPGHASVTCLIKIQSADDSTITDMSDTVFTIKAKSIKLVSEQEKVYVGTAIPLEWTQLGIEEITLDYKTARNGMWHKVKDALPATIETYNWVVPALTTDSVWVRVFDSNDSTVADEQLFAAALKTLPAMVATKYKGSSFDGHAYRSTNNKINIFKPAPGDTLKTGTTYPISWVSGNVTDSILLQFSADSGRTWKPITTLPASVAQYEWSIPNDVGNRNTYGNNRTAADILFNNCLIRAVELHSGNEMVGITGKTFSVVKPVALPVNTISFTGSYAAAQVALKWVSENEGSVNHYTVERSVDGLTYQVVDEVKATNAGSYTLIDDVKEVRTQKVFYRLKKADYDGQVTYSSILAFDLPVIGFNIYPNPANSYIKVHIANNVSGLITVQVADVSGRLVLQKTVDAATSIATLSLGHLPAGTYVVKISGDGAEYVQKIIVSR
jgi:hypothetical protein